MEIINIGVMTKIKAEIVADSLSPQGDRLTSLLITFPRIILAEVNTHRMLSKNTSSSRAIPFKKMVEAVQNDPFIPIAWQKHHSGMQGNEYWDVSIKGNPGELDHTNIPAKWLRARDTAVVMAEVLHDGPQGVTKQLCNRLLEPFMWTTMLITGSKEGWDNFFELRCPQYEYYDMLTGNQQFFKSKKDWLQYYSNKPLPKAKHISKIPENDVEWLQINKGHAEIHMMALAEAIYDAMNESTPKELQAGRWHIPFRDKLPNTFYQEYTAGRMSMQSVSQQNEEMDKFYTKLSTALAARTSYTVVGGEKELDWKKLLDLHDRLISQDPPHSSPMEHCARAMSDEEYYEFAKGRLLVHDGYGDGDSLEQNFEGDTPGWCNNFRGFIQYRYLIENCYDGFRM